MKPSVCLLTAALLGATGCGVVSRSGTRDLPLDMRSSSDRVVPFVGVDQQPSTQPSTMRARVDTLLDVPATLYDAYTGRPRVAVANLVNSSPNVRRRSINVLLSRPWGRNEEVYRKTYRALAAGDEDPVVRATAVRAINRARDPDATATLLHALGDGAPAVRLEACKALANLPSPTAIPLLRKILANESEDQDIRIAAADALRHSNELDTQRSLITQLDNRSFGIAWQCRRSLYLQTGQDLGYDQPRWLQWIADRSGKAQG
jgi:hypothetical protein